MSNPLRYFIKQKNSKAYWLLLIVVCVLPTVLFSQKPTPKVERTIDGRVELISDSLGNSIPDFSFTGYKNSSESIVDVDIKAVVPHIDRDATASIQDALDYVSSLDKNNEGYRGCVLLEKGIYKVSGNLKITNSGVVLRGSGAGEGGTILRSTGSERMAMIQIEGNKGRQIKDTLSFQTTYTPLGVQQIKINNPAKVKVGESVLIQSEFKQNWIDQLQMNSFGGETDWLGWKTDDFKISADRDISAIKGNILTLDAPLTQPLNDKFAKNYLLTFDGDPRIINSGIENLSIDSEYNIANEKDEQHRWDGISINNAKDIWVRQVNFSHLAGSAVIVLKNGKRVTVEDCISKNPISEIAAFRRNTFYTEGQQTLFQRCYAENGYHDFAVGGYGNSGLNVFLQCKSVLPYSYSGSIGSWNTGILFDNVDIDGDAISFSNKGQESRGLGWNAAYSVIWESSASRIENYSPPTAQNWAYGVWGQFAGNGNWEEVNSHIKPQSLFYALHHQRNLKNSKDFKLLELGSEPSSSPTQEQAAALTEEASAPSLSLEGFITQAKSRNKIPVDYKKAKQFNRISTKESSDKKSSQVEIKNGKLVGSNGLITGSTNAVPWWRGSLRDRDIENAQPHITRFVPGHSGKGFTDNSTETVSYMTTNNVAALDHNYGLWYERRMDDHERVRRYDADTWAPFYEQPFNRSGKSEAWDGLSKYDLTSFNIWYWDRLKQFADLAGAENKILLNENYFQHNILEAGAHWASSPWRKANNINETPFPEPPPYAGDKRIFMSKQFYDVSNDSLAALHRLFIEKNLENFRDNGNILQLISQEYTGPLHFMQFWLDVISEFESEKKNNSKITLSATKDVQDAILQNKDYLKLIDVIDIKYWYYKQDGSTYAPEGGKFLAPRQHARQMDTGKETEAQTFRAVQEYRKKYPNKAIIYNTNAASRMGWAVLMAGGSLPAIPKIEIEDFNKEVGLMQCNSAYSDLVWEMSRTGLTYLFYFKENGSIELDLSTFKGNYEAYWIDEKTGEILKEVLYKAGSSLHISNDKTGSKVIYIHKVIK